LVIGKFRGFLTVRVKEKRQTGGSGQRAVGEENRDAVGDGIAAAAAGAADGFGVRRERLAAEGADEPAKVFGLEGHKDKVLGARC
jgi:hypothetical protein